MLLLSSACLQIPELDSDAPSDAGSQDERPVTVSWVSPGPESYTNGTLQVRMEVTGPTPERVELLVDGAPVASLPASYTLDWDTGATPEGVHVLSVKAFRGSQVFVSPARTVTIDRTRPQMVFQAPATGSTLVPVGTVIQAGFSEPLHPETVGTQSIQLVSDGGALAAEVLLSEDGKILTLKPSAPLPVNSSIQVSIGGVITDLAGNRVETSQAGWMWRVPGFLPVGEPLTSEPSHPNIENISFGVGADSRPIVAWTEGWDEPFKVHVKRWMENAWEYIGTPLAPSGPGNALQSSLSMGLDGGPSVMWHENPEASVHRWVVRHWNGQAWEQLAPAVTPVLPNARAWNWQWGQGPQGHPILATEEKNEAQHQVVVRQWNGSAWNLMGAAIDLRQGSTVHFLRMKVDAQGHPFLTWLEGASEGSPDVVYAMRWTGAAWQNLAITLTEAPAALAFDAAGAPCVGTMALVSGQLQAMVKRWNGSAWANVGDVFEQLSESQYTQVGAVQFDASGRPIVALYGQQGLSTDATTIVQVRRLNGTQWEDLGGVLKATPGMLSKRQPLLGVAPDSKVFVAWTEEPPGPSSSGPRIYVYRLNH
ncbi:Ig-like domain-containing protein [Corallococcus sp. BB11-1]|uniref:Ig-like domain-containing protein n=1 Tax=Corallococcus sp. BB11-1 TaxID=2996783 RepID=UPI00226DD902|nr:Ig-like domain-containing protein [Corallococcus sp. BB11-1]MCY1030441.1 Ig-like domain-containing protein [Corallococcus sp. BB11-1]